MNRDDFLGMRRGITISTLTDNDIQAMHPVNQRNGNTRRALLMLHGFSSTPAVFRYLLPAFNHYDAIIVPTLPGHGISLDEFAGMKAKDLLSFTETLCSNLLNEFESLDVMGLSLGGLLACHLANHFALHHLYLLAPALDLHLAINQALALAKSCHALGFRTIRAVAGNLYTSNSYEIAFRQLPLTTIIELLTLIKQFNFSLPTCPVDVFLGRHDEVVASSHVADRFEHSSQATIHWLEQSAHVLPLDGDIDAIIQCVNNHNTSLAIPAQNGCPREGTTIG